MLYDRPYHDQPLVVVVVVVELVATMNDPPPGLETFLVVLQHELLLLSFDM